MAGGRKENFSYLKLLYLKELFRLNQDPYDGIMSRENLWDSTGDHICASSKFSKKLFENLQKQAEKTSIPATFNGFKLVVEEDETEYRFDERLRNQLQDYLKNLGYTDEEIKQVFANISLWDLLVIDGVLWETGVVVESILKAEHNNLMTESVVAFRSSKATSYLIDQQATEMKSRNDAFLAELHKMAFDCYLLPKIRAIQHGTQAEVEQELEFSKAADVFSSCESQLSAGRVPEEFQPAVHQLVDETAKGLSGNYDGNRYLNVVNSLPLEHTAFRIIVGAALAFAGLMLAAVAITLAVHSFGVSTPLSALGVAVGVDMMLAGFAMAAAAITLAMAGTATFFAKSKAPTEFAQQNPEGVKAITEKAEEFHAYQAVRMRG